MRTILCVLILCLAGSTYAQKNLIKWDDNRPVTWADFQGPVKRNTENKAETRSGVQYSYGSSVSNGVLTIEFEVYSYFDKDRSWTSEKRGAPELLSHEQLHFTIAELNARKLRKTFSEYPFSKNYPDEVSAIFKKSNADRRDMQDLYDSQSDHSRDDAGQLKWEKYIQAEMAKLKEFSSEKVTYVQ